MKFLHYVQYLPVSIKRYLGDPKVRAALISACDRENYNNVLLKGTFIPGKAPIPPSMDYGFDELTDPNAYNPERAKQLLAEAGWTDSNGDGILDKDGKDLSLDLSCIIAVQSFLYTLKLYKLMLKSRN